MTSEAMLITTIAMWEMMKFWTVQWLREKKAKEENNKKTAREM